MANDYINRISVFVLSFANEHEGKCSSQYSSMKGNVYLNILQWEQTALKSTKPVLIVLP